VSLIESAAVWWLLVATFGAAIVSAIVPWVNAELLLLASLPAAAAHHASVLLVLVVTAGQMLGKSLMFWTSRRAVQTPGRKLPARVESWSIRLARHPRAVIVLVGVSALVGFPPFYAVSIAAGAIGMPYRAFLAAGGAGRLAHFGLLAAVPQLLWK